jgi:predicted  nucleic acid-binding Zn-ribbon protein
MDKDTWALKLGKLASEAKERRTAAASAMKKASDRAETVRQTRARIQAEEARLQAAELLQQQHAMEMQHEASQPPAVQPSPLLESLPENPELHEFEHLDSEMAHLQSLITSLQGEKSELQALNAELVRDVLHLRSQVEGLENTISSLRDELNALRSNSQTHGSMRKMAAARVTQRMHRKRSQ